jgi:hypothetical protein
MDGPELRSVMTTFGGNQSGRNLRGFVACPIALMAMVSEEQLNAYLEIYRIAIDRARRQFGAVRFTGRPAADALN